MDLLLHTIAASQVASAYVKRKIQKQQNRSQGCHQLCHTFTAKLDPAADKKDFLCSSDTKVTSWTPLTDSQNFQIVILIYPKNFKPQARLICCRGKNEIILNPMGARSFLPEFKMCTFYFEMEILRILTQLILRVITPEPSRTVAAVEQQNWEWAK